MKKLLIKLLILLTKVHPKEKALIGDLLLLEGEVLSNVTLSVWDHKHDGNVSCELQLWYKDISQHATTKNLSLEKAQELYGLAVALIGKRT